MELSQERAQLFTALAKAQGEMEAAKKDKSNPHFKSRYADLTSVWDAVREPLAKHGLSVIQLPTQAPSGFVAVTTILAHSSGESIGETFLMPCAQPTNPQAIGSALTYARRYALSAMVGVVADLDDDGNAASTGSAAAAKALGPEAVAALKDRFEQAKGLPARTQVFMETKSMSIEPSLKKTLLSNMSETLKQMKAEAEKESK